MTSPFVSIVVPTRNGMATLPPLLDAVRSQNASFPFEIVAVDSASTDGTADLLRARADRVVSIAAEAFDHGLTRNLGIEHARGTLIVLIVQDALPLGGSWLADLIAPLTRDDRIAGAFARQQPRPDASAITRHYHAQWVAASGVDRTVAVDAAAFGTLQPMDRLLHCAFDNVCSCIRRSVWERHPFRSTPIAEDLEWAREVLLAGHRLAYVPRAVVVHSHDRSARYELARTYLLHRRLFELFQLRTIPDVRSLARAVAASVGTHVRCLRGVPSNGERFAEMRRALALAIAWPLGQYVGGLSAVRGWQPFRSRTV